MAQDSVEFNSSTSSESNIYVGDSFRAHNIVKSQNYWIVTTSTLVSLFLFFICDGNLRRGRGNR